MSRSVAFLYTDGSCKRNGDGGWAFVAVIDGLIYDEEWGNEAGVTNNRMELTAIVKAVRWAWLNAVDNVIIVTDSQYCIGMLKRGSTNNVRKHKDLILPTREFVVELGIKFEWVKGHTGNPYNERADTLCDFAAKRILQPKLRFPRHTDTLRPVKVLKQA